MKKIILYERKEMKKFFEKIKKSIQCLIVILIAIIAGVFLMLASCSDTKVDTDTVENGQPTATPSFYE